MIDEWERTPWASTAIALKPEPPREGKAEAGPFVGNVRFGTYLMPAARTPQAMMARAQAAYHTNPWIGTAEATVTRKVSGLPWHLEDENDEEYEEPYPAPVKAAFDLLERPQKLIPPELRDPGLLTRRALISLTSRHMGLCGMSYWYLDQQDTNGLPLAILYINPARIWAAATKQGKVVGWILDPADEQGHGGTPLSLNEVLPFYLDPPDFGPYGTGLYERAVLTAQITTLADQHAAYILGTGGRIPGIVSPKEGTIPDEQFKALVSEFRAVNEAPDAAKRTTVMRGPIDFTATAASPDDLDLLDLSKMNRDDIFAIWGVPPSQAGVSGSTVGLNSGETRKYEEATLMQGAVHDRVVSIRETIQFGLLDRWQETGTTIDLEIEEPEFDDRSPQFTIAKDALSQPLTNAERRELLGLAPFGEKVIGSSGVPLDDEVWLPALQTLGFSTSVTNPPQPSGVPVSTTSGTFPPLPEKATQREFLGLRHTLESRWVPTIRGKVTEVLRAQRSEVAAKLRAISPEDFARQRKNRQHWFDRNREADRLRKALQPVVAALAETVGQRTDELLGPAKADPFTDSVVSSVNTKVGARVTGITDTTQDAIAAAISQGYDDGLSPSQIADLIEGLPAFDPARAELVARTETMFAYNAAALDSYGQYGVAEVQAIDGDQDDECASRNGRIFALADADGIQDHPNGTLDWVPIFVPSKAADMDLTPVMRALMESMVSEDAKAKATLAEQSSQIDAMAERFARAVEALAAVPPAAAPQITVVAAEQPAPVVNVTVPEQAAPVVNVSPPVVNIAAPEIKLFAQPEPAKRVLYDRNGRVSGIEPVE